MPDFSLKGLSALLKGRIGEQKYSKQVNAALTLAYHGHEGQFREAADRNARLVPYIVHPVGVALLSSELMPLVEIEDEADDVLSACLTHDLIEDTEIAPFDIESATSARALQLVTALSKPPSTNFPSRDERNNAHYECIKAAGKTAVFIKICDSMHNLNRPERTPLGLLKKTVQKGRDKYIALLEFANLGSNLYEVYKSKLDETDKFVSRTRFESIAGVGNSDLDAVFAYCREKTKRKVLEQHDIVDILKEITGAMDVRVSSMLDFRASLQPEIEELNTHEADAFLKESFNNGDTLIDYWPETIRGKLAPANRLLAIKPKGMGDLRDFFLILLSPNSPDWISENVLGILISYLLERMLAHKAGELAEVSDQLRTHELSLDPSLAIQAGLSRSNIETIASKLKTAASVAKMLDSFLMKPFPKNVETRIERREARVKTSTSITQNMLQKKTELPVIEDLIGYRYIVRNPNDRGKLVDYLSKFIPETLLIESSPLSVKSIKTPTGYSSDHIVFSLYTRGSQDESISVEIQIRTILDDAWARVSQTIDFKKQNSVTAKNYKKLKKLRKIIDEFEADL